LAKNKKYTPNDQKVHALFAQKSLRTINLTKKCIFALFAVTVHFLVFGQKKLAQCLQFVFLPKTGAVSRF